VMPEDLLESRDRVAPAGVAIWLDIPPPAAGPGAIEPRIGADLLAGQWGFSEERLLRELAAHLHAGPYDRPSPSANSAPAAAA